MPIYRVEVEQLRQRTGEVKVEAASARQARAKVKRWIYARRRPISLSDPRIDWQTDEYVNDSFDVHKGTTIV